jgi:tetratricopeptide (TPR) repeat protein
MPRSSKPRRSASARPANPPRTGSSTPAPSRPASQPPSDPGAEASYRAGITAAQAGRSEEAVGHLASALHLGADQPRYWLSLATALLKASRHVEARAVLERFAERAFDDPGTLAAKGQIVQVLWSEASVLHTAGRLDEAETLCDTIILLDPEHADALQLAGDIAAKTNRPELARDLLQLAIARDPTVLPYHLLLGRILVSQNDWEGAAHAYNAAIEAHPDAAELYFNLGVALASLERFEEAIVRYAQALERNPDYVQARNNLATTLQRCGRLQEALDCFKRVETERPDHRIKANIASVLKDMGRVSRGDRALRRGDPDGAELRHPSQQPPSHEDVPGETSAAELLADARLFGECVADPLIADRPFANDRDPNRRLRIGFISGDFCNHSVMFFFEPALPEPRPDLFRGPSPTRTRPRWTRRRCASRARSITGATSAGSRTRPRVTSSRRT